MQKNFSPIGVSEAPMHRNFTPTRPSEAPEVDYFAPAGRREAPMAGPAGPAPVSGWFPASLRWGLGLGRQRRTWFGGLI